ncbi:TadE family protein [Solidesulfovibrio fructosivorans JJ]]|uniref:TadE family protein n=1 Tax=Solidesulfovibrio fructosivorans JJ] TaxID=596151 RepID=E1JTP5_SOLFR|nr:TadE/TadG family type IV pilus assembly protein [Solidesulfovibrio fructosivorans]EFL52174.1 TadE family protein [Solidesulfovibrio fructosivorans JJ]]
MRHGKTHRDQRGASVVEMALLLPVLLLVLFAIIDYGRFFYLQSMAASVASEVARTASLPDATDAAVTAELLAKLNNTSDATPPGFGLGVAPSVSITPAERVPGQPVTVSFSYPFEPLILPRLVGSALFPASITAGASAVVEP